MNDLANYFAFINERRSSSQLAESRYSSWLASYYQLEGRERQGRIYVFMLHTSACITEIHDLVKHKTIAR